LKKSIFNACNKFIQTSQTSSLKQSSPFELDACVAKLNQMNSSMSNSSYLKSIESNCSVNYYEINDVNANKQTKFPIVCTSSSGYSSTESALSVYFNLENYFYDENFASPNDKSQESTQMMKTNLIQCLLDYQIEFIEYLKNGLECFVRPLSYMLDSDQFCQIFQNIEKIYSMTEFVRASINDSLKLTSNIYESTVSVIHEYISLITSTYETYAQGFESACQRLECVQHYDKLLKSFVNKKSSKKQFQFKLNEFIKLPMKNMKKIHSAFQSILDMTNSTDLSDYERLNTICNEFRAIVEIDKQDSFDLTSEINPKDLQYKVDQQNPQPSTGFTRSSSTTSTSCRSNASTRRRIRVMKSKALKNNLANKKNRLPNDYTDKDGNKHYFI